MYTILRFGDGRRAEGLILSASPDCIRVILRRQGDTAELRRVFGEWVSSDGSSVELESMVVGDHMLSQLLSHGMDVPEHAWAAN